MTDDFNPQIHSDAPHVQICHYCNELKRFCSRVNFGNHYYCTGCTIKIGKLDIDYWKECSNIEFFRGMLKEMRKFREEGEDSEDRKNREVRSSDTPKKKRTRKNTWGCGK